MSFKVENFYFTVLQENWSDASIARFKQLCEVDMLTMKAVITKGTCWLWVYKHNKLKVVIATKMKVVLML